MKTSILKEFSNHFWNGFDMNINFQEYLNNNILEKNIMRKKKIRKIFEKL